MKNLNIQYHVRCFITYSRSVRASTRLLAAFSPSTRTMSSQFSVTVRTSCNILRVLRWYVDSADREGEAGVFGCDTCRTGDAVGVEGPRNEANLPLIVGSCNKMYSCLDNVKWW